MMPSYYEFSCPVKILAGRKALANLPHELTQLRVARPFVISDQGVVRAGLLAKVVQALADGGMTPAASFEDVPPDSSNRVVDRAATLYRDSRCDGIIAIGGGSVLDTAKGISLVIGENVKDLLAFQGVDRIHAQLPPFVAIPTTAGTGSEVTSVAVIYNEDAHAKMAFVSHKLYPHVALVDPVMMVSMPKKITAATGMDALTHAVEALYSLQRNPVSDAFAESAIKLIREWLAKAVEQGDSEDARLGMANAALLAGIAFSNSMVGIVHALAHATGGVAHVPHGVANSIYLPHGMRANRASTPKAIARVGELLGAKVAENATLADKVEAAIKAVEELRAKVSEAGGIPMRLREAGVSEAQLEAIARGTLNDGALTYNPAEIGYDEALAILRAAF